MLKAKLGRTGLVVNKDGFGALPVQRVGKKEASALLQRALSSGINFFDTARAYSNSEEKIGESISNQRDKFILATKTISQTTEGFWNDLEMSLKLLKTDHIDIYQFHNPSFCPRPNDGTGLYEAMAEARRQGKIRFIGITNHRLSVAREAVESGLYDSLQFPFSYLSSEQDKDIVKLCEEKDVAFIAMKALSGGLITDVAAARAWLAQYKNVVPIWGIQHENELDSLLDAMDAGNGLSAGNDLRTGDGLTAGYDVNACSLSDAQLARIEMDRKELGGDFCRACGYCMPCPVGIEINTCARISLLLRRAPAQQF